MSIAIVPEAIVPDASNGGVYWTNIFYDVHLDHERWHVQKVQLNGKTISVRVRDQDVETFATHIRDREKRKEWLLKTAHTS
jgi:hypothetical protein